MIVITLPDISTEDRLLTQARAGDQIAIMEIYESYFSPVYQYLRMRVESRQEAEDIAGDVFLKFIEAVKGRNAPRHSLRGWLFKVARTELSKHYGKSKQFTTTTLDEWLPASGNTEPEVMFLRTLHTERARHALRMLAEEQQEVLILRFGQALSLQETADIMGKSVSAVKSLQFRAVNTLRKILGEMQEGLADG